jgi:hypothetical protein
MGSFFKSLFDLKFETFITRKIAGIFYAISLALIGIFGILAFFGGLFTASQMLTSGWASLEQQGVVLIFGTIVLTPIGIAISVILTRLVFESSVALVTVAENTKK